MSITWKDVGQAVGKFAPMLGALVGGPAGASVGAMIASAMGTGNTPMEVQQALVTDPAAAVKLKEIESRRQVELQALMVDSAKAELAAVVQNAADINNTMQAEAKAEHWPTWSWRPFVGFVFGFNLLITTLTIAGVYLAVMLGSKEASNALATLPAMVGALGAANGVAMPILGVASWYRGKMQAAAASSGGTI